MQQSSQGLRALSRRWQAAAETTSDPELKRHFAGHVAYLTTLADRLESPAASPGDARLGPAAFRHHQRTVVLVLEDDDICREAARNILRAAGFGVICASSVDQAVHCVDDGARFDIALVDVRMPAGTPHGISFARMAHKRHPSLKFIFMSAHLRSKDLRLLDEDETFLCKPFRPHQLLDVVARAAA